MHPCLWGPGFYWAPSHTVRGPLVSSPSRGRTDTTRPRAPIINHTVGVSGARSPQHTKTLLSDRTCHGPRAHLLELRVKAWPLPGWRAFTTGHPPWEALCTWQQCSRPVGSPGPMWAHSLAVLHSFLRWQMKDLGVFDPIFFKHIYSFVLFWN